MLLRCPFRPYWPPLPAAVRTQLPSRRLCLFPAHSRPVPALYRSLHPLVRSRPALNTPQLFSVPPHSAQPARPASPTRHPTPLELPPHPTPHSAHLNPTPDDCLCPHGRCCPPPRSLCVPTFAIRASNVTGYGEGLAAAAAWAVQRRVESRQRERTRSRQVAACVCGGGGGGGKGGVAGEEGGEEGPPGLNAGPHT